jgi:hypothetical protein
MEFSRFTNLAADLVKGLMGAVKVSKGANYTLAKDEKAAVIALEATAASKTFTLDLPDGAAAIVANVGASNAFTLKNVSGDTGTSVAAGKAYLVIASTTADASKVILLNDGT